MQTPVPMRSILRLLPRRWRNDDAVVYSYDPHHDGDADPGEVVWGWVDFEDDPTNGKDRPILVVGRQGRDVVGVRLTSKDRPGDPDQLPVGAGAWDRERRPSYACVDRVLRFARGAYGAKGQRSTGTPSGGSSTSSSAARHRVRGVGYTDAVRGVVARVRLGVARPHRQAGDGPQGRVTARGPGVDRP